MKSQKELILITGGVRSGKSTFAQRLAMEKGGKTLFLATAQAGDAEMAQRIAVHKASRPEEWLTVEEPLHIAQAFSQHSHESEVIILDCLTLWVSNHLLQLFAEETEVKADESTQRGTIKEAEAFLKAYQKGSASLIVVTNEVGMGIVPDSPLSRLYRDTLGRVNQLFAARADRVYLMVAGIPVAVKGS